MLYLITNRKLIKSGKLENIVEKSALAGLDAVILREKDLSNKELFPIATLLKELSLKYDFKLIVNDNLEVAKEVDADYFHIGYEKYREEKIKVRDIPFGMSVHSLEEAIHSGRQGHHCPSPPTEPYVRY